MFSKTGFYVLGIACLAAFLKFWEPGLSGSSSTYGALALSMVKSGHWFHPALGAQLFDPFVDHPYLVLWEEALLFSIFGASAFAVRLASSISGIVIVVLLFAVVRKRFDELTAFFTVVSLMTIGQFMLFVSSGWLDIPMIAWVLAGYWALESRKFFLGGVFLGLALLAKGAGALAVFPLLAWVVLIDVRAVRKWLATLAGVVVPLCAFTAAHYLTEGFFFWSRYVHRQAVDQNQIGAQLRSWSEFLWYGGAIFGYGHIVAVLAIWGLVRLYRRGRRDLFWLILGQIAIHCAVYSSSSRHYGQYVIPVFPWIAIASGYALKRLFARWNAERAAQIAFAAAAAGFVIVGLIPLEVHAGGDHPFRAFQTALAGLKDNGRMYFYGRPDDQATWERVAGDIPWYLDRTPVIGDNDSILANLNSTDTRALAIWPLAIYKSEVAPRLGDARDLRLCVWNESYAIVAHREVCDEHVPAYRPAGPVRSGFSR